MKTSKMIGVAIACSLLFCAANAEAQELKLLTNSLKNAKALVAQGNYAGAISALSAAMFVSDNYTEQKKELWQYLGYCYFAQGDKAKIVDCYKVAYVCAGFFDDEIEAFLKKNGVTLATDYEPKYLGVYKNTQHVDTEEQAKTISGFVIQMNGKVKAKSSAELTYIDKETKDGKIAVTMVMPGLKVGEPAKVKIKGLPWGDSS